MATLQTVSATAPVAGKATEAGVLQVAYGLYNLAANPSQNDVIEFCKVPAGATIIGGFLQGADIDTGIETFDIDIGWADNGADGADTDGLGNMGVLTGDVSVHLPVAGIYVPFANILQSAGVKTFTKETTIIGTVNAAAATGGTGMLKVVVLYV